MPKNKKQHVNPRGYIAQFVDPKSRSSRIGEFVWVYERGVGIYPKSPKKLTTKNYYYTWFGPNGERNDAVDELLTVVEGRGLPVLKKLDADQDPNILTDQERYDFANFAGLLTLRVPQFRDWAEKLQVDIGRMKGQIAAAHPGYLERWAESNYPKIGKPVPNKVVIDKARAMLLDKETRITVDPLVSLQTIAHVAPMVGQYIFNLNWRLLCASKGTHFIGGDTPLVKVATEKPPPLFDGVGWATPFMEATLPLSPRTCLLMSLHHPAGTETVQIETVNEINLRTASAARDLIYSSRPIDVSALNRPANWTWWKPASAIVDLSWIEEGLDSRDTDNSE